MRQLTRCYAPLARFRHRFTLALAGLALAWLLLPGAAAPSPAPAPDWQADLQYLVTELPKHHPDLYWRTGEEEFHRAAEELKAELPELTSAQAVVGLMKLAALVGDSQTKVLPGPEAGFHVYPLVCYWFRDGIYVIKAPAAEREILGARLETIDATPWKDAVEAVSQVVSRDNNACLMLELPAWLMTAEVLEAVGVADSAEQAKFKFLLSDGTYREVTLTPLDKVDQAQLVDARDPAAATPYYLHNPGQFYWMEYLPFSQSLYISCNACLERNDLSFSNFVTSVGYALDGQPCARVILDLRLNSSGDPALFKPLADLLGARKDIPKPCPLYAVISRHTGASGVSCALALKSAAGAQFVGEPTSANPHGFSGIASFRLPSSQLVVTYPTALLTAEPQPGTLSPELAVPVEIADYVSGADRVLQTITAQ